MLPSDLKPELFAGYPPEARKLVVANIAALQQLPLSFLPGLLRQVIDYDFKFPVERATLDKEFAKLSSLSPAQTHQWFQGFAQIALSPKLESFDWINRPAEYLEQESAYLWSTHQLDAFRKAAVDYGDRMRSALPADPLPARRLGIAVIGQGVATHDGQVFRKLRAHGTYFGQVKPQGGLEKLLSAVADRAKAHPSPYGHWYVDGGQPAGQYPAVTCVSYQGLAPVRAALLKRMQNQIDRPGMGPEELRTDMARLMPSDLGMDKARDAVLDRFQVRLLTEGSGTQIFSTTFTQWTAREALRRAQPLTLLARFAPRQRQKPMNEMLSSRAGEPELDLIGSLIDADMGSYYHWINQQRLPGFENSVFLVWFEGHSQALVVSPSLPRGTESTSALDLGELLALALS